MAKLALGPQGPGYELPPEAIRKLHPELYAYLETLHRRLFGAPGSPDGLLGGDPLSGTAGATYTAAERDLLNLIVTKLNKVLT